VGVLLKKSYIKILIQNLADQTRFGINLSLDLYFAALERGQSMVEETEGNGQRSIEVTPLQLLGIILRAVLKDRITDEEVERICSVYYKAITDWWG
jgi:hypothetical protein